MPDLHLAADLYHRRCARQQLVTLAMCDAASAFMTWPALNRKDAVPLSSKAGVS